MQEQNKRVVGYQVSEAQKQNMLLAVATLIANSSKKEEMFDDWHSLLGFRIGWLQEPFLTHLCGKMCIDPKEVEVVLMHATGKTECHLHEHGESTFMTLGLSYGFEDATGGILTNTYNAPVDVYKLERVTKKEGDIFTVKPNEIHAFFSDENTLTAVGIVYPKIRKRDNVFDVVEFDFLTEGTDNPAVMKRMS